MTYYAIVEQGKETALVIVKRENGKQISEDIVRVYLNQKHALAEMRIRNNRLHASVLREYGITTVS